MQTKLFSQPFSLAERAFTQLYQQSKEKPTLTLEYSKRYKDYNARVQITGKRKHIQQLHFKLATSLQQIDTDIQIGLLQHLLNKVYQTKIRSLEQELYEKFIEHLFYKKPPEKSDPFLLQLFHELNAEYFANEMEQPTIIYGRASTRTLGHYIPLENKVTISSIFRDEPELAKFVLYHELLHKKHKIQKINGRNRSHTPAFRREEKEYAEKDIEKKIKDFANSYKKNNKTI